MGIFEPLLRANECVVRARAFLALDINLADPIWDDGEGLLNFDAQGAGTRELSENMSGLSHLLAGNPDLMEKPYRLTSEVRDYLEGIAEARGITMAQAENDYKIFLDLMNEHGLEVSTSGRYGSQSQLRFGYVVGDALGIDPAFASMMSPTGGLTGPGGTALDIDGDGFFEEVGSSVTGVGNEALSYHAPAHDAYGFLNKNFDLGPGYCYVPNGGDCFAGKGNPLSGQLSGISFWENKLGLNPVDAMVDAGQEIGREAVEGGREFFDESMEARREISEEYREAGREISEEGREAVGEVWREAREGDLLGTTSEIFEGTGEVLWQTGEGGVEILYEAGEGWVETTWEKGEGIFETGREVAEGGVEILNEIEDTIVGDGVPFVPGI